MSTFKSFEEIGAWQKARELSLEIFMMTLQKPLSKDFGLKDQINRSTGSILSNIAEGFERSGNREFIYFLSIAKGSTGEVRSQLYQALDRKHISFEDFKNLSAKTIEIGKMIGGLIVSLKNSAFKGSKFQR